MIDWNEYADFVESKVINLGSTTERLCFSVMGMAGELGEITESEKNHLLDEFGDFLFYTVYFLHVYSKELKDKEIQWTKELDDAIKAEMFSVDAFSRDDSLLGSGYLYKALPNFLESAKKGIFHNKYYGAINSCIDLFSWVLLYVTLEAIELKGSSFSVNDVVSEAIQLNITKLNARHPGGYNQDHYTGENNEQAQ